MVLRLKAWESRSPPGLPNPGSEDRIQNSEDRNQMSENGRVRGSCHALPPDSAPKAHKRGPGRSGPKTDIMKTLTSETCPLTSEPTSSTHSPAHNNPSGTTPDTPNTPNAGWSSPVARQAHNLKVVGSNPTPATKLSSHYQRLSRRTAAVSACRNAWHSRHTENQAFSTTSARSSQECQSFPTIPCHMHGT